MFSTSWSANKLEIKIARNKDQWCKQNVKAFDLDLNIQPFAKDLQDKHNCDTVRQSNSTEWSEKLHKMHIFYERRT